MLPFFFFTKQSPIIAHTQKTLEGLEYYFLK